ncbi:glucose-1-phosphate adenylyltransferase subunit GlgD, partial [Clostridium perfringens]|nr:glucose-1-phosphate adenylyltransferase subunit GlgD [Clostridium perfringens]
LVLNSIIAIGSYIEGEVKNCIIGRRVFIGKGCKLENCVIMQNTIIGNDVVMNRVIADKGTVINENEIIRGTSNYPVTIQRSKVV